MIDQESNYVLFCLRVSLEEAQSRGVESLGMIIVGSDPRSLAVGESKWDASQISELFCSMLQQYNKIRQLKLCNILDSLYKYTM